MITHVLLSLQIVADFATLVGTYARGFAVITEPFDSRTPNIPDPVIQVCCVDACPMLCGHMSKVVLQTGSFAPRFVVCPPECPCLITAMNCPAPPTPAYMPLLNHMF